ncbi:MAG: hypothetical protein M3Q97_02225, partial [Bacteroidota bacterium]|nr:hypothetical protein [Bacteroidota bacterium]
IILCEQNEKDVLEIKAQYREGIKIHYVKTMEQVIGIALLKEKITKAVNVNEPTFVLDELRPGTGGIGTNVIAQA